MQDKASLSAALGAMKPAGSHQGERLKTQAEIYGYEKFENFVRTWQLEFPIMVWFRRLQSSRLIIWLDLVTALLGFISTVVYIISTYPAFDSDPSLQLLEFTLTWFFVVDYLFRLTLFGLSYLKSWSGLLDLLTILPLLTSSDLTSSDNDNGALILRFARSNIIIFRVVRAMRFLKVFRSLRLAKFHRLLKLTDNSLFIATGALVLTVLSAITVISGVFLLLETDMGPVSPETLQFHDAFYFVATTLATIGYGDIVPVTLGAKLLVVVMMSVAVVAIPLHSAKILHLTNMLNQTGGVYYPQSGFSHVVCVVPADYPTKQLHEFLMCLLHSNFRDRSLRLRVVVLSQIETCQALKTALRHASYASIVHYISGSVHEPLDLDRIALNSAKAVFVLSRRTSADMAELNANDVSAFLTAISMKNYSPTIPTMVQINDIRNQGHVLCKTLQKFPNMQCFCVKQRTMALLAGSCVVPALHTLVCNLLQSFDPEDPVHRQDKGADAGHEWWRDYSAGSRYQTFPTVWGAYFHGWTFGEACTELAEHSSILPFAMGELTEAGNIEIQLAPCDRVIHEGELVYVLATDVHHAADLPHFTKDQYVSPHRVRVMKQRLSDGFDNAETTISPSSLPTPPISRFKRPSSEDALGIESTIRMHDRVVLPMAFQMSLLDSSREYNHLVETAGSSNRSVPVLESATNMKGHIIVCGHVDASLTEFVRTVRCRNLPVVIPIVIMQDTVLSGQLSELLVSFDEVYQLIGSVQNGADLERVNIQSASACVLLANPFQTRDIEQHDERRQIVRADYTTIINTLAIEHAEKRCDNSNTIIELLYESNLRFLRPAFTRTGTNPIDVLSSMEDNGKRLPALAVADGKIYTSRMLESVTAGSFFNPHLINVVDALIYGTVPKDNPEERLCLVLIRIPKSLGGQTYLTLLKHFVTTYLYLPVGLLRCKDPTKTKAPIPFVFTNPPPTTIVDPNDLLYVVARIEKMKLKSKLGIESKEPLELVSSVFNLGISNLASRVQTMGQTMRRELPRKATKIKLNSTKPLKTSDEISDNHSIAD